MHLAAFSVAGESVEDPLPHYRNNTGGTQSLLEAGGNWNIGLTKSRWVLWVH